MKRNKGEKPHPFEFFSLQDLIDLENKVYRNQVDFDSLNMLIQYYAVGFN